MFTLKIQTLTSINQLMKNLFFLLATILILCSCSSSKSQKQQGWINLFDGKTLNGWKVGAHPETFHVDSGAIVVNGPTAHLFYDGTVQNHNFTNFEFKASVMTTPGSNSGIYFHTAFQE